MKSKKEAFDDAISATKANPSAKDRIRVIYRGVDRGSFDPLAVDPQAGADVAMNPWLAFIRTIGIDSSG